VNDLAIILARGASLRMGTPKGLVHLEDGEPLVCRVAALYADWAEIMVVVPEGLETGYGHALAGWPGVTVLPAPGGEETARTLWHAWRTVAPDPGTNRLWAHPVDLPLVKPDTITFLRRLADQDPQAVLRPFHAGSPGHPVVIPATVMESLAMDDPGWSGPFRGILERLAATGNVRVISVEVPDAGVARDFDDPQDLARGGRLS